MKFFPNKSPRRRQQGVAVIVMLALLSIILIFVAANLCALQSVANELKMVEQRQVRRLDARTHATNVVTIQLSAPGTNATAVAIETSARPAPN